MPYSCCLGKWKNVSELSSEKSSQDDGFRRSMFERPSDIAYSGKHCVYCCGAEGAMPVAVGAADHVVTSDATI